MQHFQPDAGDDGVLAHLRSSSGTGDFILTAPSPAVSERLSAGTDAL